ncbi:hemerythrin domain-containing protein [Streptomyces griseus]|uniref:hemerythrin domain-containing protein n=1 Tax=Streptomyces griseus TaxID=1911 RepID=UPI000568DABA|nr:hemerythrin domain-containing protein [Streptomyces griseus]
MGHEGNVIQELIVDHREVEGLFEQIERHTADAATRRGLADQLTMELVRHSVAEEQHLYPAVRRYVDDGDDLADKELADHREVERLLKELEGCQADDARFDLLIAQLKSSVTEHVRDEEDRLFRLLADACPAGTLDELGDKVRAAKKTAPTRPHPAAPDTPPLNKLLAPGAGLVDRFRDMLTGRGKQG